MTTMQMLELCMALLVYHYSPGMMETVIENRQTGQAWVSLPADLPTVDGYAASTSCEDLGQIIWLQPLGSTVPESFLIVDCARPDNSDGTLARMMQSYRVAEVGYLTISRWESAGRAAYVTSPQCPREFSFSKDSP